VRLERFDSQAMGRPMHVWCFGHWGAPVLVLPSAAGTAHEWHQGGLIDALRDLIDDGRIKLYCTESNVAESWADWDGHPEHRLDRHRAFERYVLDELVPRIRDDCRTEAIPIALAGASLGALYAATFALKYPELFRYALCLSGRYDAAWLTNGFTSPELHYNNPMAFVPRLDGAELERVRRSTHLDLVCGRGAHEGTNVRSTIQFGRVLAAQSISHRRELWGREVTHEPRWWRIQAAHYLGQRFA
jgi:esterase/lipase superfamily enzyme